MSNGREIIGCQNSLLWDKKTSQKTKKRLVKAMVESGNCYGFEVWILKREKQRKLLALEMNCLRSAKYSILQKNLKNHH